MVQVLRHLRRKKPYLKQNKIQCNENKTITRNKYFKFIQCKHNYLPKAAEMRLNKICMY